ncbi:protein IQ-DOMAIN 19-like [Humulus lupulus]|uniref:protein IQ-DOMAIN 19-like n=1 Tax=Humulus lupulus TaxID=3486 RepID=UPI002B404AE2|nr:protein IQ-DOMAIN 19-like [Humulus lupulus]
MPSGNAFDMYASADAPSSIKHPGESSGEPSRKRTRPEDPPAPALSRTTTPPPPPPHSTPPFEQPGISLATNLLNNAFNSTYEKLQKFSKHRRSQEAFVNLPPLKHSQVLSRGITEVLNGILTMSNGWCRAEEIEAIHAEEIKVAKGKVTSLSEELKRTQEELAKVIAAKEKFKEASENNFKEAAKLQEDLVASIKEAIGLEERVKLLEETNSQNLERFREATFNCFYLFWKNNKEANFDYLPKKMRQVELAKCAARQEEERNAQNASDSPEISLAIGIEGAEEDAGTSVDQQSQQDPPPTAQ